MDAKDFNAITTIQGARHYIYVASVEQDKDGKFMQVCATELDENDEPVIFNKFFVEQPGHDRSDFDAAVAELISNPMSHYNDLHA